MTEQQIDGVVQAWTDMSVHMKNVSEHMMSLVSSQTSTERAARSASHSVKVAVFGIIVVLVIGGFLAGAAMQSNMTSEAAHREGMRIQLALIEKQIKAHQELTSECRRLVEESAPAPISEK
jgi:dihydroxyacetone kinase